MPAFLKRLTLISGLAAAIAACLYGLFRQSALLTLAISAGTTCYHLGARFLAGALYARCPNSWLDYRRGWYQPRNWEGTLYAALQVKRWKGRLPVYSPESFSPALHSWQEIIRTMCRSELVHETCMALSFAPLPASIWLGAFPVFLGTSVLGAGFDLLFVMIQRYNRPRAVRLARRQERARKKSAPTGGENGHGLRIAEESEPKAF